jgi:hypothetical protein
MEFYLSGNSARAHKYATAGLHIPSLIMSSHQKSQTLARLKARRAANNNFYKQMKTLDKKFAKLQHDYDTDIYFLAYRNGRFHIFTSVDQPSWPPGPDTLVSLLL